MTLINCVSGKERGRGLASIEDRVDASIQRLHRNYIEKHGENLLQPPETILTIRGPTKGQ